MVDRLKTFGVHGYYVAFFCMLFFGHKYIDILRAPFFLFVIWLLVRRRLPPAFIFDIVSIGSLSFALAAFASNLVNHVPQDEVVKVLNWLFPYLLAKYTLMKCCRIDAEGILRYLMLVAALFALIGVAGHFLGLKSLFGVELFEGGDRYRFTISATNRAGFYIGIAMIVSTYFLIQNRFQFKKAILLPAVCLLVMLGVLFLIKERKTMIMVFLSIALLTGVYHNYKLLMLSLAAAGMVLLVVPFPQRYQVKAMFIDESMQIRYNAWECAVGLFREKPVLGHGFPSFRKSCAGYFQDNEASFVFKKFANPPVAHNLSLNALAETGILGCIALNVIFFQAWRFYRYRRTCPLLFVLGVAIVFVYVTMQFGNFVHQRSRTDLAFLVFGLYRGLELLGTKAMGSPRMSKTQNTAEASGKQSSLN